MTPPTISLRRAAFCAFAACALAGCTQTQAPQNPPPVVVNPAPSSAPVAATPGSPSSTNNTNAGAGGATGASSAVADAVNKAIRTNTQMTGSRVTAVVDASGTARLTGTAQNQQQKALAETTARDTPGVTSVANKIEIVPKGGMKSAAPAAVKTKIIVVHDQAPAPSSADSSTPAPDATTGNAGTPPPSGGTSTTTTPGSTP